MLRLLEALSSAIDAGVRVFMTVVLAMIVLLVIAEVLSRNLLNISFFWLEEVTMTFLGTWLVFVGSSHAMKRGMLASMDFLVTRLPGPLRGACAIVSQIGVLVFLAVIIFYSVQLANMAIAQPSPALQVSMAFAYAGITAGACLMVLHTLAALAGLIVRRGRR